MTSKASLNHCLWWLAFVFLMAIYSVHFILIQTANMPLSPMQLSLNKPLYYWVHPYFSQRWSFFAPTPPDRDRLLVARGRCISSTGQSEETPWIDVTTPFYRAVARNRLTPLFLAELGLSNALVSYNNLLLSNPEATFDKDGHRYLKSPLSPSLDPYNTPYLTRHAAAALQVAYPEKTFSDIQLGILTRQYPRFTERSKTDEIDSKASLVEIDWQNAPRVAPFSDLPKWFSSAIRASTGNDK